MQGMAQLQAGTHLNIAIAGSSNVTRMLVLVVLVVIMRQTRWTHP
eukprot:CAMPEP_0172919642 /NCGR_PEP_ID=MMETSP1075-20121228/202546_1 /TAXON_ID=2916 /ORGANISM="Ceratium fusus, Strain PA161109" /LENGTH=44 /DNA_ID= /DNA_START= /DNA_END= /DNA_ORIENTATION=